MLIIYSAFIDTVFPSRFFTITCLYSIINRQSHFHHRLVRELVTRLLEKKIKVIILHLKKFSCSFSIDTLNDSGLRFDTINPGDFPSIVDTPYENVERLKKNFTVEDLTHQVLDNRNSTIGADQGSLEKIGRWGKN